MSHISRISAMPATYSHKLIIELDGKMTEKEEVDISSQNASTLLLGFHEIRSELEILRKSTDIFEMKRDNLEKQVQVLLIENSRLDQQVVLLQNERDAIREKVSILSASNKDILLLCEENKKLRIMLQTHEQIVEKEIAIKSEEYSRVITLSENDNIRLKQENLKVNNEIAQLTNECRVQIQSTMEIKQQLEACEGRVSKERAEKLQNGVQHDARVQELEVELKDRQKELGELLRSFHNRQGPNNNQIQAIDSWKEKCKIRDEQLKEVCKKMESVVQERDQLLTERDQLLLEAQNGMKHAKKHDEKNLGNPNSNGSRMIRPPNTGRKM